MNDSFRVRGVQRICDFNRKREQQADIEWLLSDAVLERGPIQKLHRDERLRIALANLVDGADVGMVQGRGGAGLAAESFQRLSVLGNAIRQKLQSDGAS